MGLSAHFFMKIKKNLEKIVKKVLTFMLILVILIMRKHTERGMKT